jgi:hypothetical protein
MSNGFPQLLPGPAGLKIYALLNTRACYGLASASVSGTYHKNCTRYHENGSLEITNVRA